MSLTQRRLAALSLRPRRLVSTRWFRGLGLGYGDSIFVDAPYADSARYEVAQIAGTYGMMLQPGAPVTAGAVAPGSVRVDR